jgi:hypothetical protein
MDDDDRDPQMMARGCFFLLLLAIAIWVVIFIVAYNIWT